MWTEQWQRRAVSIAPDSGCSLIPVTNSHHSHSLLPIWKTLKKNPAINEQKQPVAMDSLDHQHVAAATDEGDSAGLRATTPSTVRATCRKPRLLSPTESQDSSERIHAAPITKERLEQVALLATPPSDKNQSRTRNSTAYSEYQNTQNEDTLETYPCWYICHIFLIFVRICATLFYYRLFVTSLITSSNLYTISSFLIPLRLIDESISQVWYNIITFSQAGLKSLN